MFKTLLLAMLFSAAAVTAVQSIKTRVARPAGQQASLHPAPAQDIRGMMVLPEDGRGHFLAATQVNGIQIQAIVDTGASVIALSLEDAARIGIFPNAGDFRISLSTANGSVGAAPVMLREVRLGGILVNGVEAVVLPAGRLKTSLLGMSFLRKLSSFEVKNGSLLLKE